MFQEFFEIKTSDEEKKSNKVLGNRFVSTAITVAFGAALTFSGQSMSIWPVFGSANQLLAALALLALTVYVAFLKEKKLFVMIPALFMFAVTLTSLGTLIYTNLVTNHFILSFISFLLFLLAVLLGIKGYQVLTNNKNRVLEVESIGVAEK